MADQKKIYRAIGEAKRNGLNVGSAFRARFTGPFEAKDKDGAVIPAMLGPDCVNPETLEVTPKYNLDDEGAVLVDGAGKVVCTGTKIVARFLKGLINAKFEKPQNKPMKARREPMLGTSFMRPQYAQHTNDFYVVTVDGTFKVDDELHTRHMFVGPIDPETGKYTVVMTPIQAFKIQSADAAVEVIKDIELAIGLRAMPKNVKLVFGDLVISANFTKLGIAPIVCDWRFMEVFAESSFKRTKKRHVRKPRPQEPGLVLEADGTVSEAVPESPDAPPAPEVSLTSEAAPTATAGAE